MMSLAPCSASASAPARPMPRPAPVRNAVEPVRSNFSRYIADVLPSRVGLRATTGDGLAVCGEQPDLRPVGDRHPAAVADPDGVVGPRLDGQQHAATDLDIDQGLVAAMLQHRDLAPARTPAADQQ